MKQNPSPEGCFFIIWVLAAVLLFGCTGKKLPTSHEIDTYAHDQFIKAYIQSIKHIGTDSALYFDGKMDAYYDVEDFIVKNIR